MATIKISQPPSIEAGAKDPNAEHRGRQVIRAIDMPRLAEAAEVEEVKPNFTKGGIMINPTAAINVIIWRAIVPCNVLNVRGYRVGGTDATVNARRNGADNHLASALSLTSTDTWITGGAVQNTAYAAGDKLEIMLVTLTGAPTQIAIQVDFEPI